MNSKQFGAGLVGRAAGSALLQASVTKTASFSLPLDSNLQLIEQFSALVIILNITVADRADADELYDFYITTTEGPASWDVVHFAQIATTGAKKFVAKVLLATTPQLVTNVTAANEHSLAVVAGGANAIKSIAADSVRHGPIGSKLGYELVVAGTTPSITYEIIVRAE